MRAIGEDRGGAGQWTGMQPPRAPLDFLLAGEYTRRQPCFGKARGGPLDACRGRGRRARHAARPTATSVRLGAGDWGRLLLRRTERRTNAADRRERRALCSAPPHAAIIIPSSVTPPTGPFATPRRVRLLGLSQRQASRPNSIRGIMASRAVRRRSPASRFTTRRLPSRAASASQGHACAPERWHGEGCRRNMGRGPGSAYRPAQ